MPSSNTNVPLNQYFLQLGCLGIHAGLIILHLVLLFCGFKHWEHEITFPVEKQKTMSFLTTAISEAIGIVYGSILVFLTQKLAMQRNMRSYQTLTATHDSISSWTGFGSALATLSVTVSLDTWGFPGFNETDMSPNAGFSTEISASFLPWFRNLDDSQTLGLLNGSLYEVLQDANLGSGEAQVSAVGFNITCGTLPENITQALGGLLFEATIIIYTSVKVVDSNGQQPPGQLNYTVGQNGGINLTILQCASAVVNQSGIVDTQSRKLNASSLHPNIYKIHSSWRTLSAVDFPPQNSTPIGGNKSEWVKFMITNYRITDLFTNIEEYLMQYLNLDPLSTDVSVLKIHNIENVLSTLLATSFWIGGHTVEGVPPILAVDNTTLSQQQQLLARLNANPVTAAKGSIESIGLLQTIWLCQRYPNHPNLFQNVVDPTDSNLQKAGLVKVQLSDDTFLGPEVAQGHLYRNGGIPTKNLQLSSENHLHADSSTSSLIQQSPDTLTKHHYLKTISMILHVLLVLVHATLLGMLLSGKGHGIIFPLQLQSIVSSGIKVAANTLGTVSAWAGIGSSLSTLSQQFALPVSASTTLWILGYLSAISALHATTPALVSVEIFNLTVSSMVDIKGIPQWNSSNHTDTLSYMENLSPGFLPWLRTLDQSKTLGLFNGSLYNVLIDSFPGSGTAVVNATGFNISCGYLPGINTELNTTTSSPTGEGFYNISFTTMNGWVVVPAPGPDIITLYAMTNSSPSAYPELSGSIIVYTTSTVIDSSGQTGSPATLTQGRVNPNVPGLQFLQCFKILVSQQVTVQAGSGTIIPLSLQPTVYKNHSNWESHDVVASGSTDTTLLGGDAWVQLLATPEPRGGIGPVLNGTFGGYFTSSGLDTYLMQQLGCNPPLMFNEISGPSHTLYLHDIENALSSLVASIFWIAPGYVAPQYIVADIQNPPKLATGETMLMQVVAAARLAVSLGLGASLLALMLVVAFSTGHGSKTSLNGIGLLHIMWLFKHHPELSEIIEQVEDPTNYNLRVAGLAKTRLLDALQVSSQ
ncbi:hypothetical protein C8R44DRAFT_733006 [Mycena epipterygia]|nr:hypothetical protein C8R44DRAFT_733006 [Mycena epipterygia]